MEKLRAIKAKRRFQTINRGEAFDQMQPDLLEEEVSISEEKVNDCILSHFKIFKIFLSYLLNRTIGHSCFGQSLANGQLFQPTVFWIKT